jgi:hypothetical protein
MDSIKMWLSVDKIGLKLVTSRGMRLDPLEGGARGETSGSAIQGMGMGGDAGG